jgi:hypothetical protein
MRLLALNALTVGATFVILGLLALQAKDVLDGPASGRPSAATEPDLPWPAPAPRPRRVFGAYVDPWHVDEWSWAIGSAPQAIAKFEAFARNRTLREWTVETRRRGIRQMLVSW